MPRPPRKRLTDGDQAVWRDYARTVRALPGRTMPELPVPPDQKPEPAPDPVLPSVHTAHPPTALHIGAPPPGLDGASWRRFSAGRVVPGRTLDLHGCTVQAAFQRLHGFLRAALADRLRCVEIITGLGGAGGGILRREVPIWLEAPETRALILAIIHPHPRNPGALRLLLRRPR